MFIVDVGKYTSQMGSYGKKSVTHWRPRPMMPSGGVTYFYGKTAGLQAWPLHWYTYRQMFQKLPGMGYIYNIYWYLIYTYIGSLEASNDQSPCWIKLCYLSLPGKICKQLAENHPTGTWSRNLEMEIGYYIDFKCDPQSRTIRLNSVGSSKLNVLPGTFHIWLPYACLAISALSAFLDVVLYIKL